MNCLYFSFRFDFWEVSGRLSCLYAHPSCIQFIQNAFRVMLYPNVAHLPITPIPYSAIAFEPLSFSPSLFALEEQRLIFLSPLFPLRIYKDHTKVCVFVNRCSFLTIGAKAFPLDCGGYLAGTQQWGSLVAPQCEGALNHGHGNLMSFFFKRGICEWMLWPFGHHHTCLLLSFGCDSPYGGSLCALCWVKDTIACRGLTTLGLVAAPWGVYTDVVLSESTEETKCYDFFTTLGCPSVQPGALWWSVANDLNYDWGNMHINVLTYVPTGHLP